MSTRNSLFYRIMAWLGIAVFAILIVSLIAWIVQALTDDIPSNTIVELNLERPVLEKKPIDPVGQALTGDAIDIRTIADALAGAKEDDRVSGLLVRIGANTMTQGQAEELREAVMNFRESGKPAYIYAETFGQVADATISYYLATAFDRIYMQPHGDFNVIGMRSEHIFLGGFLDQYGIETEYDHRHEYKSAKDIITGTGFTEAFREAETAVLESRFDHLITGISDGRNLTYDEARELVDDGPWFGSQTVEAGLVDDLLFRDELFDLMREETGEDAEFFYLEKYYEEAGTTWDRGEHIALIKGDGSIVSGESHYNPLTMQAIMGSETITRAFRSAVEDEVDAIVFRISSPGGAPWASDAVRREIKRAQENDIPVITTMGNIAGSGGYFLAMAGTQVVAQPSTITASIGVVNGKFITNEFMERFGIQTDHVDTSPSSGRFSASQPFNEQQQERFDEWMDYMYEYFVDAVAEDRNMTFDEVHEIGRGRIWTGSDAKELGLVDELGGLHTAFSLALEEAGKEPDADFKVSLYPPEPTLWEAITGKRPDSGEKLALTRTWRQLHTQLKPLIHAGRATGILEPYQVYEVPGYSH